MATAGGSVASQSASASIANIAVCIATYRRAERLDALLDDLLKQDLLPAAIVVVDNDAQGTARATVERHRGRACAYPIHYDIQPARNIALTRNRTVELAASAEWLAFIDDDS